MRKKNSFVGIEQEDPKKTRKIWKRPGRFGKDQEGQAKNLVFERDSTKKGSGIDQEGLGSDQEDSGIDREGLGRNQEDRGRDEEGLGSDEEDNDADYFNNLYNYQEKSIVL